MTLPDIIAHADWSWNTSGRAVIVARRRGDRYAADLSLDATRVMRKLIAGEGRRLLGFDFPIGLPIAYAGRAGIDDFLSWLRSGPPERFFQPAALPSDIGLDCPFYPLRAGGARQETLAKGLGLNFTQLRRRCDLATNAACMFWTIGAKQCGKAALAGWRELFIPALEEKTDIAFWPFMGELDALLAGDERPVVVETYPGHAYKVLNLGKFTKSTVAGRASVAPKLAAHAQCLGLDLDPDLERALGRGFGPEDGADHAFDALVGAILMLRICRDGRADLPGDDDVRRVEGWMLGLAPTAHG